MRLPAILLTLGLAAVMAGCANDDGPDGDDPGGDSDAMMEGSAGDGAAPDEDPGSDQDSDQDPTGDGASGPDTEPADDTTAMHDGSDALDEPPASYDFPSRFEDGESSVGYGGQIARILLVEDLVGEMQRISDGVLDGSIDVATVDEQGEVLARLNAFFRDGTSDLGSRALPDLMAEGDAMCQSSYEDLSSKNLIDKLAGEDDATDHRDWDGDDSDSPAFAGWSATTGLSAGAGGGVDTPLHLIDTLFQTFEEQVRACIVSVDDCPTEPGGDSGDDALPLYVTEAGHDLTQLVEKFLFSAVNFSQGTDDYMDDDVDGKGLLVANAEADEPGSPYSPLEHHWDEGYGYFGAARDYNDYTDEEIRAAGGRAAWEHGYHDTDGDECIDVNSEINFAASTNAAKRDLGSDTMTDYTKEIFDAFLRGRWIISSADGELDADRMAELQAQRDIIVSVWEKALAATVVHYINDVVEDMGNCGSDAYSFTDHAKHWSEMKGFALAFQFNPRSPFNTADHDFDALHASFGDAPVLCTGDTASYETELTDARKALMNAYDFAQADVEAW